MPAHHDRPHRSRPPGRRTPDPGPHTTAQGPLTFTGHGEPTRTQLLAAPCGPAPARRLLYTVALAGHLLALAAPRLLGPSPTERLAAAQAHAHTLAERNRLARELHDSLGHALSVVTLQAATRTPARHRPRVRPPGPHPHRRPGPHRHRRPRTTPWACCARTPPPPAPHPPT
ncbi:histidine kinase [Nocardiopsis sp. ARC36]